MNMAKIKIPFLMFFCLMLCACQMDSDKSAEWPSQTGYTSDFENEYSKALDAYDAFMRGDIGLNDNPALTIAPTPESKYAILDMNDDGIPELAVTTVIFQERDPDTLELESTSFSSAIFSYRNGEVFIWGGGDHRHNNFEILSNKALLYDCDDGHGGREIIYHELDENGDSICTVRLWNSPDGQYYLIDYAQSDPYVEISEEEWHEIVDPILALRTDLIPWASYSMESDEPYTVSKALELVRAYIGHADSYVPLRQNTSGESIVIGDIYSVMVSEGQVASVCLYNYVYPQNELNEKWFFFHLETYFIDDTETGKWHTSSLNDFAVDKNTGEIIARLTPDGEPNRVLGSPYWN